MENNSIKDIIRGVDFRFNKALGQNFITDSNLLDAIVADSGINGDDTVVEIGTGAGTLTRAIAKVAKKVYSFEVDKNLQPVLALSLQGVDNAEVVFRDVLKMKDDELRSIVGDKFKVVANLPYYITTPLAMRFIESSLDVRSITIMVQKEVAERLISKQGSKDYGAITVQLNSIADVKLKRIVGRQMFSPVPNVDSAIIKIDIDRNKFQIDNFKLHKQLIKVAFSMRRKTLSNCLKSGFGLLASQIEELFNNCSLDLNVRGESLSISQFVMLSNELNKINLNK